MVIYFFINMFGIYDFQSHSKKIYRLIALDETKGFISVQVSKNNLEAYKGDIESIYS